MSDNSTVYVVMQTAFAVERGTISFKMLGVYRDPARAKKVAEENPGNNEAVVEGYKCRTGVLVLRGEVE